MRKRKHQRGASVLVASFVGSAIFNLLVGLPLLRVLSDLLSAGGPPPPVRVVKLSAEQWSRNRQTNERARNPALGPTRPTPNASNLQEPQKPDEPKKEEEKKVEEKLTGQIVEVPPTQDESQNPEAKYLSKYNSNVEKESTARIEERNRKMKRVTNKLQTTEQQAIEKNTVPTPNITLKGDNGTGEKDGVRTEKSGEAQQRFVLEMPDLRRRDNVQLKLGNEPGIGGSVSNRSGTAAMKGNSDRLNIQLGNGSEDSAGESGGKEGSATGTEEKKQLPTLAALLPTFGTISRMSGSPSMDHVEGVPEGDGTFLNAKEFKYATFFYRVRDSVASYWEDLASNEYRRRDPTGNIYGIRDRSTMLQVRLSRDGKLSDVKVEQTSGVDFLDHVAVEAFQKAQPFPNPPPGIADEDGSIRFNFQFVVTMRSRSPLDFFQMK